MCGCVCVFMSQSKREYCDQPGRHREALPPKAEREGGKDGGGGEFKSRSTKKWRAATVIEGIGGSTP